MRKTVMQSCAALRWYGNCYCQCWRRTHREVLSENRWKEVAIERHLTLEGSKYWRVPKRTCRARSDVKRVLAGGIMLK
jgi:hypothetical protein